MGSYLSIHNNTRDPYSVKVRNVDLAGLRLFDTLLRALRNVASLIAATGIAAPVFSVEVPTSGTMMVRGLTSASQLVAFTAIASSISGNTIAPDAAGWATALGIFLRQELQDESYVPIAPNARHRYGPFTLSLLMRAECIRIRPINPSSSQVLVDTVFMRPIASGSYAGSTRVHDIQHWINRGGHSNPNLIGVHGIENFSRASIDEASAQMEAIHDLMKVIQDTRARAMQEVLEKEGINDIPENYESA